MSAEPELSRSGMESSAAVDERPPGLSASPAPWRPSRRVLWMTMMGAATVVIAPWLLRGYTAGHDTTFHINWWLEYAKHFHDGIFHPRWAELAYRGYGEPAFVFYPPLSLYLGGLLTWLLPFHIVLGAYVWLVMVLAGFSFYYLCREFFDARAALVGAVVYVVNPYHLLEVHARCSMAELLVSASLPLLLLAIYRMRHAGRGKMGVAAVLFALVALSNIPLAVVTAYGAFGFMLALVLARKMGPAPLVRLAGAGALGAGLAGFLLLPAWYEKRWVLASVHAVVPPEAQLVPFSTPHGHWMWALAGVETALIVLGLAALLLCRKMKPQDAFWAFGGLLLTSIVLVLPVSALVWRYAPALVYVQFPFRWLGVLGLAMSFFVAAAVQQVPKGRLFAAGALAVSLATLAAFSVLINTRANILLPSLQRQFVEGRGYMGWPFVLPRDVKVDQSGVPLNLTPGDPVAAEVSPENAGAPRLQEGVVLDPWQPSSRIAITRWTAESREIVVDALHPMWIRTRVFRYPGWNAYLDGKSCDILTDARGAIVVHVPSGRSRVALRYRRTADQIWGIVLSVLSVMVLLWMLYTRDTIADRPARN